MKIAVGNSRMDKKWKNRDISWEDLCQRVSSTIRTTETVEEYRKLKKGAQDNIKDVGGFVGGQLREGRRKNGMVLCRSMLTLDMDYGEPGIWDEIDLLHDFRCCVYSTHKHTPEHPRLRMIIPLARDITEEEYPAVARMVAKEIGIDLFDDTTYEACRLMYWPSTSANGEFFYKTKEGPLLDPDAYLAKYADWHDASTWPVSSRQSEAVRRSITQQADPLEKPGIVGAFCRAYTIEEAIETFLSDVYEPSSMNGRYDYIPADSAAGSPSLTPVLKAEPVKINGLRSVNGKISFTSDRTGVNEMYILDPHSGETYQVTSTPYGADAFQFSPDGKALYYSAATHDGAVLSRTDSDSLPWKKVDFSEKYIYTVAEKLSEQERQVAAGADMISDTAHIEISSPERYRKFPHLFNIHSWAPVYFNYDNIKNLSYDYFYDMLSPGAAAVIQNSLGTFTANFGYSAHPDPYDRSSWRHSGHATFTYSGLYPVIEASIDVNDRAARNNFLLIEKADRNTYLLSIRSRASALPSVRGRVAAYIPFNFSSGGWYRGVVPQIAWSAGNDLYIGKPEQSLTASLRAYTMLGKAASEIYPDWGIGIEGGISGYLGLSDYFSPVAYAYAYGYLPGFFTTHGFRLTATGQWQTDRESLFSSGIANTLPRGFRSDGILSSYMNRFSSSYKFTAEYAIPVYLGDFNITSAFYVKRAIITPHFDMSVFPGGNLFSTGVSAAVEFGCFFWIGTPIQIGITYSYNSGKSFNSLAAAGAVAGHHYIGPVFSISLPQ